MLFAEKDSNLLTIEQRKSSSNTSNNVDKFEEDLGDLVDSPVEHVLALRNCLLKSKIDQILLVFSWTSDDLRRKFDLFPEVLTADDIKNINPEERGLC